VGIWRVSWGNKEPVTAPCKAPSGAGLTGTGVPLALPWGPYSCNASPPPPCFTLPGSLEELALTQWPIPTQY